jgi:hypothetical protein
LLYLTEDAGVDVDWVSQWDCLSTLGEDTMRQAFSEVSSTYRVIRQPGLMDTYE